MTYVSFSKPEVMDAVIRFISSSVKRHESLDQFRQFAAEEESNAATPGIAEAISVLVRDVERAVEIDSPFSNSLLVIVPDPCLDGFTRAFARTIGHAMPDTGKQELLHSFLQEVRVDTLSKDDKNFADLIAEKLRKAFSEYEAGKRS